MEPLKVLIIGAGNRGIYNYGELCKREDVDMKIVSVAEPDNAKREKMRIEHDIPLARCYENGEQALKEDKFCDIVINSTPDKTHHSITIIALEKGYHVLLEKPMATTAKECAEIVIAQKKAKTVLSVAHVLRYSPFFKKIKEVIDSGELGRMLSIDILEEVGYLHYAHSYVRGNWRREDESGPIILTKSCHDMDLINWIIDSPVREIISEGSISYFKKGNAPKGSTNRCIGNCSIKKTCPYNSEKFYLSEAESRKSGFGPMNAFAPDKSSVNAVKKELANGPYGKCVFKCDNDVNDNEEVLIKFKKPIRARFIMSSFGLKHTRKVRIYNEKGEIHGDLSKGSIRIINYTGDELGGVRTIDVAEKGGHGGGDLFLIKNFVDTIMKNNKGYNLTSAEEILQSHLMCFASEEARKTGKPVNFQTYKKKLGL